MTRSASLDSPASKTSFDSSYPERGRTRTRDSTFSALSDTTIPTISEPKSTGTSRKHSSKHSSNVNVYTTCGRHTDQFLFGGPSLGDMARSLLGRSRSRRREEKEN
ncbi:hypothetical protein VUR80DRAFT_6309 [Thermomyces stellatus]